MRPKLVGWIVGGVALLLFIPTFFDHLVAPTWDVIVTDSKNQPVPDVAVTETRQDYSCEDRNHTATANTDEHGTAHFQAIRVHRSVLKCIHETASQLTAGVHASLGNHVHIDVPGVICATDAKGYCVDWTGHPEHMTSRVTLQ